MSLYVYTYAYICICTSIYTYTYICIYVCIRMNTYKHVCVYINTHAHAKLNDYLNPEILMVFMNRYIYVYISIRSCMCIYM